MREVEDRFAASARLAGALQLPADVIVVSEAQAKDWGGVRGTTPSRRASSLPKRDGQDLVGVLAAKGGMNQTIVDLAGH